MTNFFGAHAGGDAMYAPLRCDLEQAIRGADIIGTGHSRLTDAVEGDKVLQDMGGISPRTAEQNKAQNTAERLFLNYHLAKLGALKGTLTSANIHIHLEQTGVLADLVGGSQSVTLIGCRDVVASLGARFPARQVPASGRAGGIQVREGRQPRAVAGTETATIRMSTRHWRLSSVTGGFGDLVLVGAGPCGKVYCDDVREQGGFALDIGSVMDMWAGVMTRSYMQTTKVATF